MTAEEFTKMLADMATGWTCRDYDRVAANFAETLVYTDGVNYGFGDRASLLAFFRDDGGLPQSCRFHNIFFDESRQMGCAEYTYSGSFTYHGTVWIGLGDDKIVEWREYQYRAGVSWEEFWKTKDR